MRESCERTPSEDSIRDMVCLGCDKPTEECSCEPKEK